MPQNFEFYLKSESRPRYLVYLHDNGDLEVATQSNKDGDFPALTIESIAKGHVKLCPIYNAGGD